MKHNLKKLRNEQLERLFIALKEEQPGSEEYSAIIKCINDLSHKDDGLSTRDIIDYGLKIFATAAPIFAIVLSNVYFYKAEHQKEEVIPKQQQNITQRLTKF